jgi:hypothetical protein
VFMTHSLPEEPTGPAALDCDRAGSGLAAE